MTPLTPKQAKALAIHQTSLVIAEFYSVVPEHLFSESPRKGQKMKSARAMLICHLRTQGMSLENVSRLVRRSVDSVRKAAHQAVIRMSPEERALLTVLPAIPNTLSLTNQP